MTTAPSPGESGLATGSRGEELVLEATGISWIADPGLPSERAVLRGVDLRVRAGERIGIVGASGAGKTTLLTLLAGLRDPSEGSIRRPSVPGHAPGASSGASSDARRSPGGSAVGLVFQEAERGFFEETVGADVSFGPRNAGLSESEVRARVHEVLELVGLDPERFLSRAPETLSGGEARRVAIAGVLAYAPQTLLLDEPTTGLDSGGRERLREIFAALRGRGATYAIVSHELPLLLEECERILVLHEGSLVWDGPVDRVQEGLPRAWRGDPTLWGGELLVLRERMLARGWVDPDVAASPEDLAAAWRK